MNKIKMLDTSTINKIAAGEVIERPFSVIKELVENSIDAGSSKVIIEIKEGGTSFIRITDNGIGISENEIDMAFLSHATSKIDKIGDLSSLKTLGFRGEALASIAAVSQLEVTTKTGEQADAIHLEIYGGELLGKRKTASNDGTMFLIRNLFYNTPARKKFLKSIAAETGYISDFISKIALSRPDISFRYINNGQEVIYTSGNGDLKAAIFCIYGLEYTEKLIKVDTEHEGIKITGFIAKPEVSRSNRFFEDFFVNGRYVKDKVARRGAEDAYRAYMPHGKFPAFILNMEINPKNVDVNAHPQKLEVRFAEEDKVYNAVYSAISNALGSSNLAQSATWGKSEGVASGRETDAAVEKKKGKENKADVEYPTNELPQSYAIKEEEHFVLDKQLEIDEKSENIFNEKYIFHTLSKNDELKENIPKERLLKDYKIIGQAFMTYWIVEQDKTLYIIDQHAAHERILYEKLMCELKKSNVLIQYLFVPEKLFLTEKEKGIFTENRSIFTDLGFESEIVNNDFYLKSIPVLLQTPENSNMFKQLLDMLSEDFLDKSNVDVYETKASSIAALACKAAVKGNDRLSQMEAKAIMTELLSLNNPFTCPHGRPTMIEMTKYELEKKFKRIQ